jgi:hypothetical protein
MNKRTITIGPVFLVQPVSMGQKLQEKQKDYPHLPDLTQIEVDINILNDEGGVPVVVEQYKQATHTLYLYTPSYALELCETEAQNGYRIERIEPTSVQMYDRLAQGALSVCATRWHLSTQEKDIPNSQSSHWELLKKEWQQLQQQIRRMEAYQARGEGNQDSPLPDRPALPPHHERFLELAVSLIEVTHQLDKAATAKQRQDRAAITAQQAAVARLKEGKSANPHLLPVLVDRNYQPYELALVPSKMGTLTREEAEVVQKGLAVPDVLLVHDTPTAEQVHAAVKLVQVYATTKQRVLVAARSPRTLQRLLAQLPEELLIVDLQPDGRSTGATRTRSLQVQARKIQQQLLARTEKDLPLLTRLAVSKKTIDQWVERLQRHIGSLSDGSMLQQLPALRQRLVEIEQVISAPFLPMLAEAALVIQQLEENLAAQKNKLENINERQAANEEMRQKPAIGRLFTSVEHLAQNWIKRQQALVDSMQEELDTRKQGYQQGQETMQQVIREDPEYAWCLQRIQEIEEQRTMALAEAKKAALILQETLQELMPTQPLLEPLNELTLQHYLNWFMLTKTLFEQRHALLQEWRTQLSQRVEQLYPNLLRYADVVCGTPADIAACPALEQVEFDLVIVEDAAQMALPELLVPLVKARRAVLMGDPQRLPPFPEQAATFWQATPAASKKRQLDEVLSRQVTTQLTYSTFELLWTSLVDSRHTIQLKTPHQIPRIIADFVSGHFYDEMLMKIVDEGDKEEKAVALEKTLSAHPLVLVDTSAMPDEQRRESLPSKTKGKIEPEPEDWGQPGYINRGEAKLLADLAVAYQREGYNWMILTPYSAQAAYITSYLYNVLQKRLTIDENELKERIGTVEALQDHTADVVFYSFTRSNSAGKVGYLRELRLLNVALTRAQKQAILVGDLATLKRADHEPLRKLIDALSKYVEQYGELLAYDKCQSRVQSGSLAV